MGASLSSWAAHHLLDPLPHLTPYAHPSQICWPIFTSQFISATLALFLPCHPVEPKKSKNEKGKKLQSSQVQVIDSIQNAF
jgi:hypothetical protein